MQALILLALLSSDKPDVPLNYSCCATLRLIDRGDCAPPGCDVAADWYASEIVGTDCGDGCGLDIHAQTASLCDDVLRFEQYNAVSRADCQMSSLSWCSVECPDSKPWFDLTAECGTCY